MKLRLTRVGSKKNPVYRIVAADSRSPRDGKFLEIVGRYNPQTDPSTIEVTRSGSRTGSRRARSPTATGREAAEELKGASAGRRSDGVEYLELARRLVDEPDAVRAEEIERDGDVVIELRVAPDDVGKVIGRQGRIARALRTVVRASAARRDQRVLLEIVE